MAQIPLGNFDLPRAVPRTQPSRVDLSGSMEAGRAIERAGQTLAGIGENLGQQAQAKREEADRQAEALARAKATNAVAEHRLRVSAAVNDVQDQLRRGVDFTRAGELYDARMREIQIPTIPGLPADVAERYQGGIRENDVAGRLQLDGAIVSARRDAGQIEFGRLLETLEKTASGSAENVAKQIALARALAPTFQEDFGLDGSALSQSVQAMADRSWSSHAGERLLIASEDPQALSMLEQDLAEDGFYADKLDPGKRNVIRSQILGRRDQLERRAQAAADRSEAVAERALTKFEAQIATGVMAPVKQMEEWQAAVVAGTPEQRERFDALLGGEAELRKVRSLPPVEQRAYLQNLRAQQQTEGATATQVGNLRRMESLIESDLKRLAEAPLVYDAILNGTRVDPLDVKALFSGDLAAVERQISDRMVTLSRLRKQYGAEVGDALLLPEEASALAGIARGASSRETAQLFGMLNRAIADPAAYQAVLQQVVPDSPVRAMAGRLYALQRAGGPPDGQVTASAPNARFGDVSMMLLKGASLLNPTKEEAGRDGKGAAFPMPEPQLMETSIANQVGTAFAGRAQEFATATQAIRAYYAARSADEGDVGGRLNPKRLREAVQAVVGEKARFEGRDVLPPWGMSSGEFRDKAKHYVQARLRAANLQDPGDVALMNVRGRDNVYVLVRGIEPLVDRRGIPLVIRMGARR